MAQVTGRYHIGSQHGRVPMHESPDNEGGMGWEGVEPSRMKM
jgi:hypothetical protein